MQNNLHFTKICHGAPCFRNWTVQVIAREFTVIDGEKEFVIQNNILIPVIEDIKHD